VPVFGEGKAVSGSKARVQEHVELSEPNNRIEVSVLDTSGTESLRDDVLVPWDGKPERDLYFLGFGVSTYRDARLNLGYPHKDVQDLASLLSTGDRGFRKVHVRTYVNEAVTPESIRDAKAFFEEAKLGDVAVLFVAGHGTHARDAAADYLFVTYGADLSH